MASGKRCIISPGHTNFMKINVFYAPEVLAFVTQVLMAEYDVQKAIAPFLKIPALRTIVQTFTNDTNGDFQKWAGNPSVLEMLTQAKRLLDEGHMTEAEMEQSFLECCNVWFRCFVPIHHVNDVILLNSLSS